MKKSILGLMVVLSLCILCVGCGKSEFDEAREKSMITADIKTAEQIGKILKIAIDDEKIENQINNGYKKCSDVDGLIGEYLGQDNPLSLENGSYYIKSENDIIKVVIATSEDEANEVTEQYDGTKAGIAYVSE